MLSRSGVVFQSQEALDLFKKAGCCVDGDRVFITKSFLEEKLKSCPKEIGLKSRNRSQEIRIGDGKKYMIPMTWALYIRDMDGKRRRAEAQDAVQIYKLTQCSDMFSLIGSKAVSAGDVPEEQQVHFEMASVLSLTDKALLGHAQNGKSAEASIRWARCAFGNEPGPFILGILNVNTPLSYDPDAIETLKAYVTSGQASCITSCAHSGVSAPVTLAGTLVVSNAELLAGIVLTQLYQEGAPVIYGNVSCVGDMRTMGLACGAPESALLTQAASELAKFYGLPSRGGCLVNDAIAPDIQAGYESMMYMNGVLSSEIDLVMHSAGVLESFMTFSFEKFIIDEEIFNYANRIARGIEVSPDTLAVDEIIKIGPLGSYLASKHTHKYFRTELTRPLVSNRDAYDKWVVQSKDMLETAHNTWKKRLLEYKKPSAALDEKTIENIWIKEFRGAPELIRDVLKLGSLK